jgi:uncharacterized OB-fold protein
MTTTERRKLPAPLANPENQPFYDATAKGTLLVGKCHECGAFHYYPRRLCPHCFSDRTEWVAAAGTGTIYSYSTMHRGVPVPYTIAYVTLDEGVTMMTNIVDFASGSLSIGQKVKVTFQEAEGGASIPMFTPA